MPSILGPDGVFNQLKQAARNLGTELPEQFLIDMQDADAVIARGILYVDREALQSRLTDAMEAGTDPLDDVDTQRDAVRMALSPLQMGGINTQFAQNLKRTALIEHTPAIVASWATEVGWASQSIAKAKKKLPGVDLSVTNTTGMRADELAIWGEAKAAIAKIGIIYQAWLLLGSETANVNMGPYDQPHVFAELTSDEYSALPQKTETAVAQSGHELKLATFDEWRKRVKNFNDDREREWQLQQADKRNKMRLNR